MSISFDGPNLTISYDDAGVLVEVEAKELYSRWKDWTLAGNAQYPPAFRTIGGDPLGGSVVAGDYYFLNNADGWRLKPKEASHELVIVGNLYGEDPDTAIFAPTVGSYNVLVQRALSSLTQTVAVGSGLDTTQDTRLEEVHQRLGLAAGKPLTQTATEIATDDWTLSVGESSGTVTVERQP